MQLIDNKPVTYFHLCGLLPMALQVAIVGKGLTFDSGGYNLKAGPGSMIELMKFDMGGAAATLGAARILATTQPEGVEVGTIACSTRVEAACMRSCCVA